MAKKNVKAVAAPKRNKVAITLVRKAKKVLQSNGLHYFKEWAEKSFNGGRRKKAQRGAFKLENSKVYNQLVAKGTAMDRRMDRGPKPKKQPEPKE